MRAEIGAQVNEMRLGKKDRSRLSSSLLLGGELGQQEMGIMKVPGRSLPRRYYIDHKETVTNRSQ